MWRISESLCCGRRELLREVLHAEEEVLVPDDEPVEVAHLGGALQHSVCTRRARPHPCDFSLALTHSEVLIPERVSL